MAQTKLPGLPVWPQCHDNYDLSIFSVCQFAVAHLQHLSPISFDGTDSALLLALQYVCRDLETMFFIVVAYVDKSSIQFVKSYNDPFCPRLCNHAWEFSEGKQNLLAHSAFQEHLRACTQKVGSRMDGNGSNAKSTQTLKLDQLRNKSKVIQLFNLTFHICKIWIAMPFSEIWCYN